MAHEAVFQALREEVATLNAHLTAAKGFLGDLRGYAIDMKALVEAGRVTFDGTQPVSIPGLPSPLPVSLPVSVEPNRALVSLSATGDLVAAQGAGVAIRLMAGVLGAVTAVTLALRSGTTDLLTLRLAANATVVLPWNDAGWCVTAANQPLRVAFAGANTVTAFGLWMPA
jgi:hypothetical protein